MPVAVKQFVEKQLGPFYVNHTKVTV